MIGNKYNVRNLIRAIRDPKLFANEIKSLFRQARSRAFETRHGPAFDIMDADWDVLILLDACRYDYFERTIDLEGELKPIVSPGAHSWEFMRNAFVGNKFHDTVYVTANPHAQKLDKDIFYTIENILDAWNSEIGTVPPEEVVKTALEANDKFPNKRLIIHFMQPHEPHMGPTAEKIRERVELTGWDKHHGNPEKKVDLDGVHTWQAVKDGTVSIEEVRRSYSESLEIVIDHASDLIDGIDGRTVISSDHGEMLGERGVIQRRFGHPHDIYCPELRVIPWFISPSDTRRTVEPEKPIGFDRFDDETVNNRLVSLGYKPE